MARRLGGSSAWLAALFRAEAVIISAGGVLPTGLLKQVGIEFETKHGTA